VSLFYETFVAPESYECRIRSVDFTMTNADVTGQKHMWIDFFDLRLTGLIMNFEISIGNLFIEGDHRTRANMMNGIVTVPISGAGRVRMDCQKVQVQATAQLRTLPGGNLNMERMVSTVQVGAVDARLTGFGALDGAVSRMISNSAPGMVAENQDRISTTVEAFLIPALNRFLNQHTMTSLVNLMADRNQNPPPRRCFW
jgi:Haemolymph juvenile hormone binding protein (JHBP)